MKIVEYKLHLINGVSRDPEWIVKGKYFYNSEDKTFIGFVLDSVDRDYYIPDTVVELTREDLIQRCISIHAVSPYKKTIGDDSTNIVDLTEAEIPDMVDAIINSL